MYLSDRRRGASNLLEYLRRQILKRQCTVSTVTSRVLVYQTSLGSPMGPSKMFLLTNPSNANGARATETLTRFICKSRGGLVAVGVARFRRTRAISALGNTPPKCINFNRKKALAREIDRGPCDIVLLSRVRGTRPSILRFFFRVFSLKVVRSSRNGVISFQSYLVVVASGLTDRGVADV